MKSQPGQVSFLPSFSGDGYGYGGGIVVTFGEIAIQLGETSPNDQSRLELARLIASAPALLAMVERYASECGECRGSGEKPFYSPEGTGGRMPPETPPCEACADIRSLIKSARGNQS